MMKSGLMGSDTIPNSEAKHCNLTPDKATWWVPAIQGWNTKLALYCVEPIK